jgi:hypothetical protein
MSETADSAAAPQPNGPDRAAAPGFVARWCRPFVLLVLFAISGAVVWAGNALGWPAALAFGAVGGFTGLLAGGLVGVSVVQTFAALTVFVCAFEGIAWGALHHGWIGAVFVGLAGIVVGHILGSLPLALVLIFADLPQAESAADRPSA